MKVLLSFRMSARALAFLLVAGALCGCGEDEGSAGHQRLSDFVPIKVVVADIAAIDEDGVTALYRVSGSAFLKVPVESIVQEPGKAGNGVVLKKVPMLWIDSSSVDLFSRRSWGTSPFRSCSMVMPKRRVKSISV